MNPLPENTPIAFGTAIRMLAAREGDAANTVRVGGIAVPFTDEQNKDHYGTWWDKDSYLGARSSDGLGLADTYVHHRIPLDKTKPELVELSKRRLMPSTLRVTPEGLWAETVLDLNDKYEKRVAEMVEAKRLFWSSASTPHLFDYDEETGYVREWPVAEVSLTPTPGTPQKRTQITTLRSLMDAEDLAGVETPEVTRALTEKPADVAFTSAKIARMCSTICSASAQMASDKVGAGILYSHSYICSAIAVCIEETYYQCSWGNNTDAGFIAQCMELCEALCRQCAAMCTMCAAACADTIMANLCTSGATAVTACGDACAALKAPEVTGETSMSMRSIMEPAIETMAALRAALPETMRSSIPDWTDTIRASEILADKHYTSLKDAHEKIGGVLTAHESNKAKKSTRTDEAEGNEETGEAAVEVPATRRLSTEELLAIATITIR